MPALSRWMLTLCFFYLFCGTTLGALLLTQQAGFSLGGIESKLVSLVMLHPLWLLVGWMAQCVLGMAYWIFPRLQKRERPRPFLAILSCLSLNLGLFLYSFSSLFFASSSFFFVSNILLFLAFPLMFLHLHPRIKGFGSASANATEKAVTQHPPVV